MANPYSKYAQQTGRGVVITDPYREAEEQRKAAEEQRRQQDQAFEAERLRIAQQNAQITAQNANKPPSGYRWSADGALEVIPGGPADKSADGPPINPDRIPQLESMLANIRRVREMAHDTLAVGALSGRVGDWPLIGPWLGQNRANIEGALQMIQGDLIQQQIAILSEMNNGGGVATMANSETEAARMAASIANLDPNQSLEEFLGGLDRAEQYYLRQLERQLPENAAPLSLSAAGVGATQRAVPIPPEMQAENEAWLNQNLGTATPDEYVRFRQGLDRKYGMEPPPATGLSAWFEGAQRDAIAGGNVPTAIPPASEEMGAADQFLNNLVSSPAGSFAASAANAGGFGIPSLMAGDQYEAMRELNPVSSFLGEVGGGITGTLTAGAGMAALGGRAGNEAVARLLANPLTADMAYGGVYGATQAEDPLYGAIGGAGAALAGNAAGNWIARRLPGLTGVRRAEDPLGRGERALYDAVDRTGMDPVLEELAKADALGVPASLADVSRDVNTLTGAALRRSPTASGQAADILGQRSRGQYDRFLGAVERDLGPVANIPQRSDDLIAQARAAAGPLYERAYQAPGVTDLDLTDLLSRPSMQQALKNARRIAMEEGRNPDELGFVLNDAGDVVLSDAGRFVDPQGGAPQSPASVLRELGEKAPADLVTFVRRNGGLRDQAGELRFIGANNAARRGVPFAGQDTKAGPLVSESGRNFDDMAEAAWEAGYFGPPETTPRPTTREFLESLEDTLTGSRRVFSIYDEDVVQRYFDAEDAMSSWRRDAEGMVVDSSTPAGPDVPFAPPEAFGEYQPISPTWQTLDYVKRGLDDVLEGYRDKTTGRLVLDTEGRAVNDTLREFLSRVDAANPDYAAARAAYAGPAAEREAMRRGQDALRLSPDQLGVNVSNASPGQVEQMRLGFQSGLAESAARARNNANPFQAILDTPAMEQRLNTMYDPDSVASLLAQRDLERGIAASTNRLIGNSMTAERQLADEAFGQSSLMGEAVPMAIETSLSGAPFATGLRSIASRLGGQAARDRRLLGRGARATELAEEIVPLALETNPATAAQTLQDLAARDAAYQAIVEELLRTASVRGGHGGAAIGSTINAQIQR